MTKVTLIRKGQRIPTYIRIDLKSLYQDIRSGAYLNMVEQVREDYPLTLLHNGWKLTDMERLDKVPRICFACEWRKKRNQASIDAFNGLILLEINSLADVDDAQSICTKAAQIPYSLLTFIGATEHSVKIICQAQRPDGSLPATREERETFLVEAYDKLHYIYSTQL